MNRHPVLQIKEPIIRGMQLIRAFGLYKDGELGPQWLEYPHNQHHWRRRRCLIFSSMIFHQWVNLLIAV